MTKRALLLILCAAVLLVCALSTRGALFWQLFWLLMMMLASGLAASIWTRSTLTVSCELEETQVTRGARIILSVTLRHTCPLPVAALRVDVYGVSGEESVPIYSAARPFASTTLRYAIYCPHVGTFPSGVEGVAVRDVFGLFSFYRRMSSQRGELVVLPQTYVIDPLAFSPGESDNESVTARAFEDATMPTDLRAFQQGDELKKVHWKLSMRRKELLVRVYDQPQRPDVLLLVDCSPPQASGRMQAVLRDAICEATASLAAVALSDGAPVRMPLLSERPMDINASRAEDIAMIRDALARCPFDGTLQFERVLLLETRRMRRTGATAVVTSRMSPVIADMILRIRRMGPKVRVLLTARGEDEFTSQLITRLMRNDVEVETIEIMET
ncbi:DUF58 domain-containing protein [Eubacteriales bacterium OttesenSCG-928-A19]|nr:DUF58 domain-containing protein [Eubacteriales bacterium OttesenSCG-928-A19]